jgi:hypothetical protein
VRKRGHKRSLASKVGESKGALLLIHTLDLQVFYLKMMMGHSFDQVL